MNIHYEKTFKPLIIIMIVGVIISFAAGYYSSYLSDKKSVDGFNFFVNGFVKCDEYCSGINQSGYVGVMRVNENNHVNCYCLSPVPKKNQGG